MDEPQSDAQQPASSTPAERGSVQGALAAAARIGQLGMRQDVWAEAARALHALTGADVLCLEANRAGQLMASTLPRSKVNRAAADRIAERLTETWQRETASSLVELDEGRIVAMPCSENGNIRGGFVLVSEDGTPFTVENQAVLALITMSAAHRLREIAVWATSVPLDRHEAALAGQRAELSHTLHAGPAQDMAMAHMALAHLLSADIDPAIADAARIALAYVRLAGENLRQFMMRLRGEPVGETAIRDPAQGTGSFFPGIGQEDAILAIVREAIRNSRTHAQAETVTVTVTRGHDGLRVQLTDDGQGFSGPPPAGHFGLAEMRELAEGLGGDLEISSATGEGTTIIFTVPEPVADQTRRNGNRTR